MVAEPIARPKRPIPLVDLGAQYALYGDELETAVSACVKTSRFIGGPVVREFEQAFADYCGGGQVVTCGNGTDALILALVAALGQGRGADEIVTTTHTFAATAEAIAHAGYRPVLVDIEPTSGLMAIEAVKRALSPKTRAILPVHLYGRMVAMDALEVLARKAGIAIIEDAAQAHGATWRGEQPGYRSRAAAFSFFPGKNLGAWGDGGAVFTRDAELAERLRMLADHGRSEKYVHQWVGRNSRLDSVQAAVLGVKLRYLDKWNASRRALAARYREKLARLPAVRCLENHPEAGHVHHLFVIDVPNRDGLSLALKQRGIATGVHYPRPLHRQPAFAYLGYLAGEFPNAEELCDRILTLPIYPELGFENVDFIVEEVARFFEENGKRP